MKFRIPVILFTAVLLAAGALFLTEEAEKPEQSLNSEKKINAVIGDESYVLIHGDKPGAGVSEDYRIRTHLSHVERKLRARPVDHLTSEQKANREKSLDLLRDYYLAGNFPQNDGHPDQRRPTFIDVHGNICAVGYLIEQTAGRDVAESINESFKYAYIPQIEGEVFEKWVENSGFTTKELAMIQPAYERETVKRSRNTMDLSYGLPSSAIATLNAVYLTNRSANPWLQESPRTIHLLGLAAGAGSIAFGLSNLDQTESYLETADGEPFTTCAGICFYNRVEETNYLKKGVSAANIGVGVFNVARALYRLTISDGTDPGRTEIGMTHIQTGTSGLESPVPAIQINMNF